MPNQSPHSVHFQSYCEQESYRELVRKLNPYRQSAAGPSLQYRILIFEDVGHILNESIFGLAD